MSLWYYSFVHISRVKQTTFHQFHDMMLFKICFTYKSLPLNVKGLVKKYGGGVGRSIWKYG